MSRPPTGAVPPARSCPGTRRAARRVVTRVRGRPAAVLRRRPGQDGAGPAPAGGDPAGMVRIHLLDLTGALVPLVLDDPDRG